MRGIIALVVLDYLPFPAAWFAGVKQRSGGAGGSQEGLIFVMVGVAALVDRTGAIGEPYSELWHAGFIFQ